MEYRDGLRKMVSTTGKYALRILGCLVGHPDKTMLAKEIAAETGVPVNYSSKILNQLRKKGLVRSRKGWGGGFMIEPGALGVRISEVLELFEGQSKEAACALGLSPCGGENPCPLHGRWERICAEYRGMLDEISIGELPARKA